MTEQVQNTPIESNENVAQQSDVAESNQASAASSAEAWESMTQGATSVLRQIGNGGDAQRAQVTGDKIQRQIEHRGDGQRDPVAGDSIQRQLENRINRVQGRLERFMPNITEIANDSLTDQIMGNRLKLQEQLRELGITSPDLDQQIAERQEQLETAQNLQGAILNGDVNALQEAMRTMQPEQLSQVLETIQQNLDKLNTGMNVELVDGKLVISVEGQNRAVAITPDGTDVIGFNLDGSYNFNAQFPRENAARELQNLRFAAESNHMRSWFYKLHGRSGGGSGLIDVMPYPGRIERLEPSGSRNTHRSTLPGIIIE